MHEYTCMFYSVNSITSNHSASLTLKSVIWMVIGPMNTKNGNSLIYTDHQVSWKYRLILCMQLIHCGIPLQLMHRYPSHIECTYILSWCSPPLSIPCWHDHTHCCLLYSNGLSCFALWISRGAHPEISFSLIGNEMLFSCFVSYVKPLTRLRRILGIHFPAGAELNQGAGAWFLTRAVFSTSTIL